ncbi:hypothetical protein [Ascidiimonas aurantiaca]|uniref:hypothetical protein n=1 Tax=Ascidiimonas aurantiaca TaxID=1685432 RepID=UPI0030EB18A9
MMKTLKNFLMLFALTAAMVACSSDDDGDGGTNPNPPVEQKDGSIDSQTDPDLDAADLKGSVTVDITLDAATNWVLSGSLRVKEGATLTIEPGTTIRAVSGGTDVFIAIEQGAQINAAGTSSSPITMTSNAGNPRGGDWGGLLIAGRAPINTGDTAETEVVGINYGGSVADDNSGVITYVKLEYTGARINGDQEFNGLSLYGVGSGTVVNHVAVFFGEDDGIEWFGGTVQSDNLLVVNAKDDWFDWTEGWNGGGDNWYGIRTEDFTDATSDPRGIEADSNSRNNDATPRSNPTINGLTLVHASNFEMADMIKIRRGSAATIDNVLVALIGDATAGDFIDLNDGSGTADASTSITGAVGFGIDITDINNPVSATIEAIEGATGGADVTVFAWTGFTFPAIAN